MDFRPSLFVSKNANRVKKLNRILLPALLLMCCVTSCGIVHYRNSPTYYAGDPHKAGYTELGIIEEVVQPCSVPGPTQRRMIVYLPPEYYRDSTARYPVFYLLHGARGYETSWIRKGMVYESTDSLFREGLAVPCIVVMPNVNQYNDDKDYENARFKDAYESILEVNGVVESAFVHDVVRLTDSLYRTIPDKDHRALAGLSIGGYQSIWLSANHPDTFGYIGALSPYTWSMSWPNRYRRQFYSGLAGKLKKQFADPPKGYYLFAGKTDMMRPSTLSLHLYMEDRGYPHDYIVYPGGHTYKNGWIDEYQDMLQRVFRD